MTENAQSAVHEAPRAFPSVEGRTALVTGGAGFIGSNLVEKLLVLGARVRVFDDLSTGHMKNLDEAERAAIAASKSFARSSERQPTVLGLEFFQGCVRDATALKAAMRGVDLVFHLAALPSVMRSIEDPVRSNEINIGGTTNVILAARDAGVRRIVFASSSAIYGDLPELPKREDMQPMPLSPYAIQKFTGEHYAAIAGPLWGVDMVPLRFFNVFGPRQDPKSDYAAVIPKFIAALLQGKAPIIFGDGLQSRDFTYVANVVHALIAAATAPTPAILGGRPLNIGCGERTTLLDLAKLLAEITGHPEIRPSHAPPRAGDVKHSHASIDRARLSIDYAPATSLRQGLELTVNAMKALAQKP